MKLKKLALLMGGGFLIALCFLLAIVIQNVIVRSNSLTQTGGVKQSEKEISGERLIRKQQLVDYYDESVSAGVHAVLEKAVNRRQTNDHEVLFQEPEAKSSFLIDCQLTMNLSEKQSFLTEKTLCFQTEKKNPFFRKQYLLPTYSLDPEVELSMRNLEMLAQAPIVEMLNMEPVESSPTTEEVATEAPLEASPVVEEEKHYVDWGEWEITAYCPCKICSEGYGTGTASNNTAVQGRTIAAPPNVPFGTVLEIDGTEYVVEDRGGLIKGRKIDVYFDSHRDADNFGVQLKRVREVVMK